VANRIALQAAGILFGLLAGCGTKAPSTQPVEPADGQPTSRPARPMIERVGGGSRPLPVAPENPPTMLAGGKLPVVHLFAAGGRIRVHDATANRQLAAGVAPPNSIISVTANGITVAKTKLLNGPLPADRTYEIWFDPSPAP
jgi:hypothetical protein